MAAFFVAADGVFFISNNKSDVCALYNVGAMSGRFQRVMIPSIKAIIFQYNMAAYLVATNVVTFIANNMCRHVHFKQSRCYVRAIAESDDTLVLTNT